MQIIKNYDSETPLNEIKDSEWIETNGLGGWSSSTVSGLNTRKYHGILVPSLDPPVDRRVYLSRLDETLLISGSEYPLATREFPGTIWPEGYKKLKSFEKDFFPSFTFEINVDGSNMQLQKTIAMLHGKNSVVICYELKNAPNNVTMKLEPFISARDYHNLTSHNYVINPNVIQEPGIVHFQPYENFPPLKIITKNGIYYHEPSWYYQFEYDKEKERGLGYREDLYKYGYISLDMKPNEKYYVLVTIEDKSPDAKEAFDQELLRRKELLNNLPYNDLFFQTLVLAADQFIVERDEGAASIIAGYHWFADWGRDTMIALPGLCLYTGRIQEAKKILLKYGEYVSDGMLPNRFADKDNIPEYNTVDATLWYFIAIYKTYKVTQDKALIEKLYPIMLDIIKWHYHGTRYNIKVDTDGLLYAGTSSSQLTWMDAKIDGQVVTSRTGKAVEINALWYNALCITSEIAEILGDKKSAIEFTEKAKHTAENFIKLFWNSELNYLNDVVDRNKIDSTLRPNQIFALSLPFKLLPDQMAVSVLNIVKSKLLTPYGLRTLSIDDRNYHGRYIGDQWQRDHAYHQGTIWSWLIGPFITAYVRYSEEKEKKEAMNLLTGLQEHLQYGGLGTISEIFDGDPPHYFRGCIAQAWGVAEIIRVYVEDIKSLDVGVR